MLRSSAGPIARSGSLMSAPSLLWTLSGVEVQGRTAGTKARDVCQRLLRNVHESDAHSGWSVVRGRPRPAHDAVGIDHEAVRKNEVNRDAGAGSGRLVRGDEHAAGRDIERQPRVDVRLAGEADLDLDEH